MSLLINPTPADFVDWAIENSVHVAVIGFGSLYGKMNRLGWAYVGPDGWLEVSRRLHADQWDGFEDVLGEEGAQHFGSHLKLFRYMPTYASIVDGEVKALPEALSATDAASSIVVMLIGGLMQDIRDAKNRWGSEWQESDAYKQFHTRVETGLRFVVDNLEGEWVIYYVKGLMDLHAAEKVPLLIFEREWVKKLVTRYSSLLSP